jgi:rfaE bifunctional protein nucleotidyltransferase chain/domain
VTAGGSASRVVTVEAAAKDAAKWRESGERVVLANGVFDLLHVGHARYLAGARERGDRLIVAVNGDRAAARQKGAGRPVLPAAERARIVAAFAGVDRVVVFEEPTVDGLLEAIRPAVHAKGTDYEASGVPERATAAALGIETAIVGDPKAHDSRGIVSLIRERHRET